MVLWIIFAALTAGVAAVLILPLARNAKAVSAGHAADRAGEIAVYRDQLKELERDQSLGLIDAQQADYARAEIGRRLLAAAGPEETADGGSAKLKSHGLTTIVVTLVPPIVGLCLYLMLGNPNLPDQPLEARLANPGNDISLLVAKAERHLAQNPNDGAGWDLLAPIYFRSARLGDAELAYRNAIRLLGANPDRLAGLGETLVMANDGIVTEDAKTSFEGSLRLNGDNPRASFYLGLALEQAGKTDEARAAFEAMARKSDPDAPWMELVNAHIAKNGGAVSSGNETASANTGKAPGNPTDEQVAATRDMSNADRQEMIRGMVETLAARLEDNPDNLEGWLRLVRSYAVLGDREKAQEALGKGLAQFPAEGGEGRQLVALAKEIGLAIEGATPPGVTQ